MSTHQLELGASRVGLLYAGVRPERAQRHYVQLELTGLDPRSAYAALPRHHQHALLLIFTALPADTQLVAGIHQHTHALQTHTRRAAACLNVADIFLTTQMGGKKRV